MTALLYRSPGFCSIVKTRIPLLPGSIIRVLVVDGERGISCHGDKEMNMDCVDTGKVIDRRDLQFACDASTPLGWVRARRHYGPFESHSVKG